MKRSIDCVAASSVKRVKTQGRLSVVVSFVAKTVRIPPPFESIPAKPADFLDPSLLLVRATARHRGLDRLYNAWRLVDEVLPATALSRLVVEYMEPPVDVERYVHVRVAYESIPQAGLAVQGLPRLLEAAEFSVSSAEDYIHTHDLSLPGAWPAAAESRLHGQPLAWHRVAMASLAPRILAPSVVDSGRLKSVVLEGGQWCVDLAAGRLYAAAPAQRTAACTIRWRGALLSAPTGAGKTALAISLARVRTHRYPLGAVVVTPGQHRVCLPGTTVVVVPPHLVHQWRTALMREAPGELLTVEDVRGLRRMQSPAYLARYRFVLINATFLTSNVRALRTAWETVRSTLATVEFGARIVDEYTEVVPTDPRLARGSDRVFFPVSKALSLLQLLSTASTTLLVSATPYTDMYTRWFHLLCTSVLLGAEYDGRLLFGPVDETPLLECLADEQVVFSGNPSAYERADVVHRVLHAMRQPYFPVPPTGLHELHVHLVDVPPSPVTLACRAHDLHTSLQGVQLRVSSGYKLPTASVFRNHYNRVDMTGRPCYQSFRSRVDAMVREGKADIRDLPETTVFPAPVTVLQTGPSLELPAGHAEESWSNAPDGWIAVAGLMRSFGPTSRVLLFVDETDLVTMGTVLGILNIKVLVLKGNSKALSSRIERFKGGQSAAMVVPSSHCSGMNLPMVTHIVVPYLPTNCHQASLRQLIGRVQRHGSTSQTQVVFVASDMVCATQQKRALASIEA